MLFFRNKNLFHRAIAGVLVIAFLWQDCAFAVSDMPARHGHAMQIQTLLTDPALRQRFIPLIQRYLESGSLERRRPVDPALAMPVITRRLHALEPWLADFGAELGYDGFQLDGDGLGSEVIIRFKKAGRRITVRYYDRSIHDPWDLRKKIELNGAVWKDVVVSGEEPQAPTDTPTVDNRSKDEPGTPAEQVPPAVETEASRSLLDTIREKLSAYYWRFIWWLMPDGPADFYARASMAVWMALSLGLLPDDASDAGLAAGAMIGSTNHKSNGSVQARLREAVAEGFVAVINAMLSGASKSVTTQYNDAAASFLRALTAVLIDEGGIAEFTPTSLVAFVERTVQQEAKHYKKAEFSSRIVHEFDGTVAAAFVQLAAGMAKGDMGRDIVIEAARVAGERSLTSWAKDMAIGAHVYGALMYVYHEEGRFREEVELVLRKAISGVLSGADLTTGILEPLQDVCEPLVELGHSRAAIALSEAMAANPSYDKKLRFFAMATLTTRLLECDAFRDPDARARCLAYAREGIALADELIPAQQPDEILDLIRKYRLMMSETVVRLQIFEGSPDGVEEALRCVEACDADLLVSAYEIAYTSRAILLQKTDPGAADKIFTMLHERVDAWQPHKDDAFSVTDAPETFRGYFHARLRRAQGEKAPLVPVYEELLRMPNNDNTLLGIGYDYVSLLRELGDHAKARTLLVDFLARVKRVAEQKGKRVSHLVNLLTFDSTTQDTDRVLDAAEEIVYDVSAWPSLPAGALDVAAEFLVLYGRGDARAICKRLETAAALPADQLAGVVSVLARYDGPGTRAFLRRLAARADAGVRDGYERCLRQHAARDEKTIIRDMEYLADLMLVANMLGEGWLGASAILDRLLDEGYDEYFAAVGDDPVRLFELARRLDEYMSARSGNRVIFSRAYLKAEYAVVQQMMNLPDDQHERAAACKKAEKFLAFFLDFDRKRVRGFYDELSRHSPSHAAEIYFNYYARAANLARTVHVPRQARISWSAISARSSLRGRISGGST